LRQALREQLAASKALGIASQLLASEIDVALISSELGAIPVACEAVLINATQHTFMGVKVEPSLAAAALSRILNRPVRLQDPAVPLDSALRGAFAALAVEITRTASHRGVWAVHAEAPEALPPLGLLLDCEVVLDGKRYRATVWFAVPDGASLRPRALSWHDYPAGLVLQVPLVVGRAATPAGELSDLQCGDVWLSGTGWWIDHRLRGKGALCAPGANAGVAVDVYEDRIVLGKGSATMSSGTETRGDDALAQTLAEVPIEVRVELGSISLPAAEWAQLQAGDVIPFASKHSPIRLRANGTVIAEGELVRVDDELGVRITAIPSSKAT
jgi:type III secretion system YscQ/HrcQ family protein